MKKLTLLFLVGMVLVWPIATLAATFQAGESYSLGRGQSVTDDLYVGSGSIAVSGNVQGDLIAAGGNISVTGGVSEDLMIAGGMLTVSGSVGDDARIAGGNVTLDGSVADDVFVAGGQIHLTSSSVVQGDVVVAGGQVTLNGRINGNVKVISGKVSLGDTAIIGGNFSYTSPEQAMISSSARISGMTSFNQVQKFDREKFIGPFIVFSYITKLIICAIAAVLFVLIFRTKAPRVVHQALGNFGENLLRGFLVLIAVPVAIFFVSFTVIGIPFAVLAFLGYVAWMILAGIGAGITFGAWMAKVLMKREPAPVDWKVALLGTAALFVLQLVPLIGWIACSVFFLVTLGAISREWYDSAWKNR